MRCGRDRGPRIHLQAVGAAAGTVVRTVLAVIAMAVGSAAAEDSVPRAGIVLVDPAQRRAEIVSYAPSVASRLCAVELYTLDGVQVPIRTPGVVGTGTLDPRLDGFAYLVAENAAAHLAGNADAGERAKANLLAWARGGALGPFDDDHPNTFVSVDRVLLTAIASAALLRDRFADAEWRTVRDWLAEVVNRHDGRRRACASCERDADRNLRAAVDAAWGALTGDAARYHAGIAWYRTAIAALTPKGGFPAEMAKGEFGLWGTSRAIAPLVAIAEIAAVRGDDLYALAPEGASLHTAVAFFLDGVARIDDHGRRILDAAPGSFPHGRQRAGFLYSQPNGRHALAWAEAYVARFPDHPNSRRLRELFEDGRVIARDVLVNESVGGNATCLFAGPDPLTPEVPEPPAGGAQ